MCLNPENYVFGVEDGKSGFVLIAKGIEANPNKMPSHYKYEKSE